jgi:hypothetical protein
MAVRLTCLRFETLIHACPLLWLPLLPQVMYLSSRSISQANITRDYINTLVQGEHRMPVGPVIISPHGLLPSLYRYRGDTLS